MIQQGSYEPSADTGGHHVSFRDRDDQPCPNCGAVVDEFAAGGRHGSYRGYECPECDVSWDFKEWADGVDKYPDPEPEHEAAPLNRRLMAHAYRDLFGAVEDGVFTIETPRGSVDTSACSHVNLDLSREVEHVGPRGEATVVSGYSITLDTEFRDHPEAASDFRSHTKSRGEKGVVLHGRMHLWRMQQPHPRTMSQSTPLDGPTETDLTIEWKRVEEVGWR